MTSFADVVLMGETMGMLRHDSSGAVAVGSRFTLGFGGAESNVAIGLSRLGIRTLWVSALGADSFGEMIELNLRAEGVSTTVRLDSTRPTGLMLKHPRTDDTRMVTYFRSNSAASALTPDDVPEEEISRASIVHLSGITPALSESCRETIGHMLDVAQQNRVPISFDINYRDALWTRSEAAQVIAPIAQRASILFGGPEELSLLNDSVDEPLQVLRSLAQMGHSHVVMKRGVAGADSLVEGVHHHAEPPSVEIVDTVGAGDAFVAGYLASILGGLSPADSIIRATVCGTLACTHSGDWEGSPTSVQLESLLEAARQ